MRISRRLLGISIGLFVISELLFLVNIQFPRGLNFDEFHYVPSAKQFLQLKENQNYEHPPLGKILIAAGMGIWGDRPIGWRFMSSIFGSLTLVGMFFWALALFRNEQLAILVAILTLSNQLLYVQARIGMLDTFMFAFVTWALAAFTAAWDRRTTPSQAYRFLIFAGAMFGLGAATKWVGIVPWGSSLILLGSLRVMQGWGVTFSRPSPWSKDEPDFQSWYSPELLKGVSTWRLVVAMGAVPFVLYFSTFLPYLFLHREPPYGLLDLLQMQIRMYGDQLRVVTDHPYMSQWWSWPMMLRPIWYAFEKEGVHQEWVRGVILLGNPLIMWTGLAAIVLSVWAWLARNSREAFLICAFYAMFFLCWVIIPRKVSFYYYYYPAGMVLGLALAFLFSRWDLTVRMEGEGASVAQHAPVGRWAFAAFSVAIFIYFFPILAALKIPANSFVHWMWFTGWI